MVKCELAWSLYMAIRSGYVDNLDCHVVKKNVDEIKMKYLLSLR